MGGVRPAIGVTIEHLPTGTKVRRSSYSYHGMEKLKASAMKELEAKVRHFPLVPLGPPMVIRDYNIIDGVITDCVTGARVEGSLKLEAYLNGDAPRD